MGLAPFNTKPFLVGKSVAPLFLKASNLAGVCVRSRSLSYLVGTFIKCALSFINPEPCLGLVSASAHISSAGQCFRLILPLST